VANGLLAHPAFGAVVRYSAEPLPEDSDSATAITIEAMADMASADSHSPEIRRIAGSLGGRDRSGLAQAAFWHVRRGLRFVRDSALASPLGRVLDPQHAEILIRPVDIIRMPEGSGDCDDFSMLLASILLAADIPVLFVAVAADPEAPERYSHVYVRAEVRPGEWMALDASHGSYPGWEVADVFGKRRAWPAGGGGMRFHDAEGMSLGLSAADALGVLAQLGAELPWWQKVISGVTDIAKARYAVPPAGTYIQTPGGTIQREGSYPMLPFPQASGAGLGFGIGTGAVVVGVGLVLLLVMRGGRR
jgi:hypothetical protein